MKDVLLNPFAQTVACLVLAASAAVVAAFVPGAADMLHMIAAAFMAIPVKLPSRVSVTADDAKSTIVEKAMDVAVDASK